MTGKQFEDIIKWQNETFGRASTMSKMHHLLQEIIELVEAIRSNDPNKRLEFADCFLLLFGAAASDGMSYYEICQAINEKMEINKKRKWGEPDKNGVVNHIKDGE